MARAPNELNFERALILNFSAPDLSYSSTDGAGGTVEAVLGGPAFEVEFGVPRP